MTDLFPLKIKIKALLEGIQGDLELRFEAMNGNENAKALLENGLEDRKKALASHIKGIKYSIGGLNAIFDAYLETIQELQNIKGLGNET